MKRIVMMIGLPRSGKSTRAKELNDLHGWPIVSSDAMRLAVHGKRYWAPGEPQVWAAVKLMVTALFNAGHDTIILDNTNTEEKYRKEWTSLCDEMKYVYVECSVDECQERALATGQADLLPVIEKMYEKLELPKKYLKV